MNKTRAREELCEKLAAHPKFPWGKGLTLSGDHVLMSDDTFDPEMSRPVYDVDEERVYNESIDELRKFGLLLEHPTTIGWMFTTLVELWAKSVTPVGVHQTSTGVWVVQRRRDFLGGAETLGVADQLGEALGHALLTSWSDGGTNTRAALALCERGDAR